MDYNLKEDVITTKSSTVVKLSNFLTLTTTEETIDLRVEIVADFENIPHKYHEIFLNMLTSKYLGKVSFSDNPFSVCRVSEKKSWFSKMFKFFNKK